MVPGLLLSACSDREGTAEAWKMADRIAKQVVLPEIPADTFDLAAYGGSGDGLTDNKPAFDQAVGACSEAGGGVLLVRPGDYLVNGPIHLESHINLHLQQGARIFFGSEPADYLPMVLTSWEGTRCYNYSPFIYAYRVTDVAITGSGTIDGEGAEPWNGWKEFQEPDQRLIRMMNNDTVPISERLFGEGHYLRPHLVQFYKSGNILVEGVHITDSPFWCLHFVYSNNITVRGVTYDAYNLNNDGIDPESSENILIEDVTFGNRDDNIAIKSGRDLDARTLGIPSRNIVIRNCRFKGHNAIAVGSEMSGGVENVFVEDCGVAGKVEYGFYLKGNRDRGGYVSDIYARNIQFDTTRAAIVIDSNYKNQGSCCPPLFSNIHAERITAVHAIDYGIYLKGYAESPLDSVYISRVTVESAGEPLFFEEVEHLSLKKVSINGKSYSGTEKDLPKGSGTAEATGGKSL
jgi:polygalacturonase